MARVDEKYETLLQLAPDPIFLVDASSGQIREINEQGVDRLGYEKERLVGMDVGSLHPSTQSEAYRELFEQTLAEGTVRTDTLPNGEQIYLVTDEGDRIPVELHAQTITVEDETWVYTIARDITEWKRATEHLERQRDLLDVLNQVVRHDLRNDLQVVGTYTELLEDSTDEEAREHLETIQECTTNAVEFTATAGDLAEVIRNPDRETSRIQLTEVLEAQCEKVQEMHPDAVVECADVQSGIEVTATEMLGSAFRNLLQNAIQHNDAGTPEVSISAERNDDTVEIRVADNGRGIPDDRKGDIFDKGQRGLESEGTGIGLYLAQTLVEAYDGDIDIEDNDPTGSVFIVRLPTAD